MDTEPLKTTVSDGLAKMLKASEQLSEEQLNKLADRARRGVSSVQNKKIDVMIAPGNRKE